MSGATAGGWPYVTPDDHPLEFPALSQQLAAKLEASGATVILSALTPAAGWADFGSGWAGMHLTRQGRLITISAMLKPTADKALTVNQEVIVATVPVAHLPAVAVEGTCHYTATTANTITRLSLNTGGQVSFRAQAAATMPAASGFMGFSLTYRSAT